MKLLLVFLLSVSTLFCQSQTVVKYYDDAGAAVPQDKAVYYANFIKEGNLYKTNSYWVAGNVLRGKSTYADTILQNPIGIQLLYSRKCPLQDSGV